MSRLLSLPSGSILMRSSNNPLSREVSLGSGFSGSDAPRGGWPIIEGLESGEAPTTADFPKVTLLKGVGDEEVLILGATKASNGAIGTGESVRETSSICTSRIGCLGEVGFVVVGG